MKEEIENNSSNNVELSGIVIALLNALDDRNEDVKQSIIASIVKMSERNADVTIRTAIYFWELHRKMSTEHKISLLNTMSGMCKYVTSNSNTDLASSVTDLALNELTGETENEAVKLLIALSRTHCIQAMGGLLSRLKPGILPHHVIVSTIGKLALANPYGMLSFVKLTLTIIRPMLSQIREEILKQAVCFMTGKFCEAINDYLTNTEDAAPEINKETYKEEICSVFDFLTSNWLKTSRDSQSLEAILTALVSMIPLLPQELDSDRVIKLIPICLTLCKKQDIRLATVKVLAVALNYSSDGEKEAVRPYIDHMHYTLFGFVSIQPFEVSRDVLLTHYEVLQCFRSLSVLYPEEGLDRILQHLKSSSANQRARALVVLRHLINTLPSEDDGSLHRIALHLQDCLGENGALQMVGAIVALAVRPTFSLLPSQRAQFIRYMVSRCGMKNDDSEAHTEALYLLATTVDGAESWLWPCLIDALLDPICAPAATSVLRALSPLATKIISNEHSAERDFPGTKVLGRCLELLSDPVNQFATVTFLKAAAPLMGHQVKSLWDEKLSELSQFLQDQAKEPLKDPVQRHIIWEEKVVKWLEESVKLEGESWGAKLADELALKTSEPGIAPLLALMCNNNAHITLLIELARSHSTNREFARAVGICAKRHLNTVLKIMEEFCIMEDTRKVPVKLIVFMKDLMRDISKATLTDAVRAGLLQCYAEIAQRGRPQEFFPAFEKHVLPWSIKQLNLSRESSLREAGLSVLEQVAKAIHPINWPEFKGLQMKSSALALLMGMLQSPSGYKPFQLYTVILKTAIALIRIPPALSNEENEIFLSGVLDKTISSTTEIFLLLNPETFEQVVNELGILTTEIVSDSADTLAVLVDILLPWMQSKSCTERKTTLLVLDTVLRSYYNSIKYTYPGGKFDAGKLVGRIISWCAITEPSLRSLIIDCVLYSLNIACRHRSILSDSLDENLNQIKKDIINDDTSMFLQAVKNLAKVVSERIPDGEIVGLAEGLIEGLLFSGEGSLVSSIALSQHFTIKGSEISRNDVRLVDNILTHMKYMENANCRTTAGTAIILLMVHHPEEVTEHLLCQPLPLDQATETCWKEIGCNDIGYRALELLLLKLEASSQFSEIITIQHSEKNIASFSSLTAIIALRYLLQSSNAESLIDKQLARLLSILLKYLSGWLRVDPPTAVVNTKYGYIPNRNMSKLNPYAEVYHVLINVLTIVNPNVASSLLNDTVFTSDAKAEESVISTIRTLMRCISNRNDILSTMAQSMGKLMTSTIAIQRAVAIAFYSELVGKVNCGVIWLDAIINTLHEAKNDSSPLVRTLATTGLARIANLEEKVVDLYFDNCIEALLEGLEEPVNSEGNGEVVLESLRGLSMMLSVHYKTSTGSRVVMALKPFIEKENPDLKLAAISILGVIASNWQRTMSNDDNSLPDDFLWCLPCLIVTLEDSNIIIAKTAQETLYKAANILQCEKLSHVILGNLGPQGKFNFASFSKDLIDCLKEELPQKAEEFRNTMVRGYSRSENHCTRATSALLLGLFGSSRPEDIQRLLQLLRDRESIVRIRASQALSYYFSF